MIELRRLARELGANEDTLRRAARVGTIRAEQLRARSWYVTEAEREYALRHWDLLATLKRSLRTQRNVRIAVVYGAIARGDDHPGSQLDLLAGFLKDGPDAAATLADRMERALGRPVGVARLNRTERLFPLLMIQVLGEGRVVIDRAHQWARVVDRRASIAVRARGERKVLRQRARTSERKMREEV
jgi:predicted nucleotidyltransferase